MHAYEVIITEMTFRTIWEVETVCAEDKVWQLAQNSEEPRDSLRREGTVNQGRRAGGTQKQKVERAEKPGKGQAPEQDGVRCS